MLRVIAVRDAALNWRAWWKDMPSEYEESGSMLGAVARLLVTRGRGVSMSDLVIDPKVSRPWHVEMTVVNENGMLD